MDEQYAAVIEQVTPILHDAVIVMGANRLMRPLELDAVLREILRRVGSAVMGTVLEALSVERRKKKRPFMIYSSKLSKDSHHPTP